MTGIIGDAANQVSKVFDFVEVGAVDADLRRTESVLRRGLVQHLFRLPEFLAASEKRLIICCKLPPCGQGGLSRQQTEAQR